MQFALDERLMLWEGTSTSVIVERGVGHIDKIPPFIEKFKQSIVQGQCA